MTSLIGVGDNTVDIYVHQGMRYPGGNAVNVAVFAKRYGHPSAYLGWVGNDRNGQLILSSLQQEGLDLSRCRSVEGPTACGSVDLVNGDRVFGCSDHGVSKWINLTDEDYAYISQFDIVHTSTYSHLESSLAELKKASRFLSFDFSDKKDPNYLGSVFPYVDIALLSRKHFSDMEASLPRFHAMGPRLILVTCGSEGAWVSDGHNVFHQEVKPVQVVDTLGAGDAFVARFLVEIGEGQPIPAAMSCAAQSASLACMEFGAFGHGESK